MESITLGRVASEHREDRMSPLHRWGDLVVRHPWQVLLVPIILAVALLPLALRATDNLAANGWVPPQAEAQRVQDLVAEEFGQTGSSHFILFSDPTGTLRPSDREFRLAVEQAVRPLRADPTVADVYTWGSTSNDTLNRVLISADGTQTIAVVVLAETETSASEAIAHLEDALVDTELDARIGGWPATTNAFMEVAEHDLLRAEVVSLPITLGLLLLVFGGVLAASLPIILAVLSMVLAFAAMWAVAQVTLVSTFSINAVTMLGLAVSIDYALIMVSRFREERARQSLPDAVRLTVATAGRAVIGAGATVAIGVSGLVLFRVPAAVSTGIIAAAVIGIAVLLALTVLPATFVLAGDRIGTRRTTPLRLPRRGGQVLKAIGRWRERYPLATVVLTAIFLVSLALPARHMALSSPTITSLPRSTEARQVADEIAASFPHATLSPIAIVVQPTGDSMYSADNLQALRDYVVALSSLPGIDRADSIWSLLPSAMTPSTYSTSLVLEPDLGRVSTPYLTPRAALVNITVDPGLSDDERRDLVREIRATAQSMAGRDLQVLVGGNVGMDVDVMDFAADHMPNVVVAIISLTGLALLVQLRSVFLPLKAIAMNLLSIGASFGALVWIFQDGHLSNVLRFEPSGTTVVLVPILMFCFLFGLSMDFEIIMLSRIREGWQATGDNNRAVQSGLHHTAGIVTSSALVMLAVFAAFATSELGIIKALGVGLAIAVALDATVIRLLLLPATMQLMGRWNWWAPFQRNPRARQDSLPEPAD